MEYRELLLRYAECIGIDEKDSRTFRRFRQDFTDAIVEIYGESPPTKVFRKQLAETEDFTEDFTDSTLLTDWAVDAGFTIAGGKATTITTGKLTISNLQQITELTVKASGTVTAPPATIFSVGTVKVYSELGEELFSDTFTLTDVNGAEEIFTFSMALSQTNMYIEIEFTKGAQYTNVSLNEVILNVEDNSFLLPDDFVLPLEVKFEETSEKRHIISNEMHRERFERWTPNRLLPDGSLSNTVEDFTEYYATSENFDYDFSVGYFFDKQPEGMYFRWKPKFAGTVTVVYGYLPTSYINPQEGDLISFQRVYIDLILYNAVIRGYRKKMASVKLGAGIEGEVILMRTLLSEYKNEYIKLLHKYTNYMKASAEPKRIYPMDFLNDSEMELN